MLEYLKKIGTDISTSKVYNKARNKAWKILGKISKRSKFNRKMIRFTVTKNLNCFIANFFNFFHHCSGAIQKL